MDYLLAAEPKRAPGDEASRITVSESSLRYSLASSTCQRWELCRVAADAAQMVAQNCACWP